jgi:cytochrome b
MLDDAQASTLRIRVWDWPTRIIHWLFVLLIPLAWWTAEEHHFDWHRRAGYLLLALLIFRLIWGFVGSSTARFSTFLSGPRAIFEYVRGGEHGPKRIGHNPLGAWSVVALLSLMLLQVALGLFSIDVDGLESGPLADKISFDSGRWAADLHELNFYLLFGFIALHISAILFYTVVRRERLIQPMITGFATGVAGTEQMRRAPLWRAILTILIAFALIWWVSTGAPWPF